MGVEDFRNEKSRTHENFKEPFLKEQRWGVKI